MGLGFMSCSKTGSIGSMTDCTVLVVGGNEVEPQNIYWRDGELFQRPVSETRRV